MKFNIYSFLAFVIFSSVGSTADGSGGKNDLIDPQGKLLCKVVDKSLGRDKFTTLTPPDFEQLKLLTKGTSIIIRGTDYNITETRVTFFNTQFSYKNEIISRESNEISSEEALKQMAGKKLYLFQSDLRADEFYWSFSWREGANDLLVRFEYKIQKKTL